MMKRPDGREPDELRKTRIRRGYLKYGEGSVLRETGHTRVICTATVEGNLAAQARIKFMLVDAE